MSTRKLRIKRSEPVDPSEAIYRMVDLRIAKALEAIGERQKATENALHTIANIMREIRSIAILAASDGGAVSRRFDSFLESLSAAMDDKSILNNTLDEITRCEVVLRAIYQDDTTELTDDMVELLSLEADEDNIADL